MANSEKEKLPKAVDIIVDHIMKRGTFQDVNSFVSLPNEQGDTLNVHVILKWKHGEDQELQINTVPKEKIPPKRKSKK